MLIYLWLEEGPYWFWGPNGQGSTLSLNFVSISHFNPAISGSTMMILYTYILHYLRKVPIHVKVKGQGQSYSLKTEGVFIP